MKAVEMLFSRDEPHCGSELCLQNVRVLES